MTIGPRAINAGGIAGVDGYVNVVPRMVHAAGKIAIAYEACATHRGTTISGDLDFSQTVDAGVAIYNEWKPSIPGTSSSASP